MAIVTYIHTAGTKPTPEQIARIREAAKRPIVYDEDCPRLTEKQLAEFRPVNGMTWEERAVLMEEAYRNGTLERPRTEDFEETESYKPEEVLAEVIT